MRAKLIQFNDALQAEIVSHILGALQDIDVIN